MAWIEQTKNGCFRVGWREPAGRQRYRTAPTREQAEAFRLEIEHLGSLASPPPTLGEYITGMLDTAWNLRGSSIYAYRGVFRRHITGPLGNRSITEISTEELRAFLGSLECGPSARASVYRLLAKAFNQAVREGSLDRSPLKAISRPKENRREIRPLSMEEMEALAAAADARYRVPILIAGYLGLRAGEIGGVHLQDVDFQRGTLQVVRATRREGGRRVLGDVKTAAGRRRITVPASLLKEIRLHVVVYPPAEDGRIFSAPRGALLVNIVLWQALGDAARRLGVRRPRFHDLRHSAAALMIAQGAHPKLIQARLGHSNIQVTLDVYGHLLPALDEDLSAGINEARTRLLGMRAES